MKKLLNLSCLLVLLFSSWKSFSQSTSWKGTANVNWNNVANWTNGLPDLTKDAIVGDASFTGVFQPKVNVVSTCKSINVGGAIASTLTLTRALTVAGNFTINPNGIVTHPAATVYVAGNFNNNGSYITTATSSRIIFNGINQTIGGTAPTAFRFLVVNAGCTVSLAANISITGAGSNLGVYGVIDPGQSPGYTIASTGISKVYDMGKIKVYAANFTSNYNLTGVTTLYSGSIVEYASTTLNQVISPVYSYSTLMISGAGTTKSLNANLPLLYGKNAANGKILVNSGTFDMGIFTANRATNAAGGELNIANGAFLKVGGTSNFPINFATKVLAVSSTVEYNGTDQTISPQLYGNLLFSTAGIKSAVIGFSTAGDFTITNGTLNTMAVAVTHSIAGNFIMSGGAITGTNYTIALTGTTHQTLNLLTSLYKLNINNTGGVVNLGADITVTNTLSFTKGNIQTANFNVIIPSTATVSGASQSTGWVNGNLQKHITTGSGVFKSFETGTANYSPVSLLFSSVSIGGELTASATSADQPEIDYSGIDPAKSVNRYWSLNNSGILFSNATAIFNWMAADVDGAATTTNFKTGLFNGSSWALTSSSSALPTSIQASGLTTLGDFCVGEIIGKSTWTGNAMTADWFTAKNWLGLIPSVSNPTFIPNGLSGGRVYPVLNTGTASVNNITVETAATLTVSSAILQIAGDLVSTNNVNVTAGTIEFNGNVPQTIAAGSFTGNSIKNLTINNNVSLVDNTNVTGTLAVGNGKTLTTNDNLVLRSTASGTARLANLPVDGSGNATAFVTGKVSIERYIPARKAWRLLSTPIQTSSTITIQDAWQEGAYSQSSFAPNPNPNPGYGVHIVGGTLANGFDQSTTNNATLKVYSSTSNSFVALPATPGTFLPIKNYTGYLVYIRGDRSIDLSQGNSAAITATTLRMKGMLNTGNQVSTIGATNFTVLGNPYPSAIDFASLTRNNVKNSFYIWDPKLTGSNGLGAYVTVSWNSSSNSYDVTSSASPISQYIPSGEAILVESADGINPGTVTIKESDKTISGSDLLFGRNASAGQKLRINMYSQEADGSSALLDAALTTYAANNLNQLDRDDIKKLHTESESISLTRAGQELAIERRKTISGNDTSFLNIASLKPQTYKIGIIAEQFNSPGITAILKDNFSTQLNNTVINLTGTTEISFSVTDNPASYAADRFSIVFSKAATTDIYAFKAVKATLQQKNISVEWQTENELKGNNYEVEGSADGIKFTKLSTVSAKGISASTYAWFDLNATAGDHYYRVKYAGLNAEKKYSMNVKVTVAGATNTLEAKTMTVYPNPVKNNLVSLQLAYLERGMYVVEITNVNGQMVKRISLLHNGGTIKYSFPVNNLSAGKYQVKLTDGATVSYTTSMIKE